MITDAGIPYVQSSASLQVPPPYHFPGVTVNAFIWEARMGPISAFCDRYYNLGSAKERGFNYRPAAFWPYAMLLFLDYPKMISSNPAPEDFGQVPYCDRGLVTQTEVFIALPVVRHGTSALTALTQTQLEFSLPLIVVGNPMSAVCGREMLGLGKLLADIVTGEGVNPGSFGGSVTLPGWRNKGSGITQEMLRFLSVETGPVLPSFRAADRQRSMATLFESREFGWMMDGMSSVANALDTSTFGLFPTAMRTVGLKQYRDAADPQQAVYQALMTCRANYSNVRGFNFYDEDQIDISFHDIGSFHDILSVFLDLGEGPSHGPVSVNAVAGFRFIADIDYDSMRVIHRYPITDQYGKTIIPQASDLDAGWYRPLHGFFGSAPQ